MLICTTSWDLTIYVEFGDLLWTSSICAQSIPVLLPATVNDRARCSYYRNMTSRDLNWFELRAIGEIETRPPFEGN